MKVTLQSNKTALTLTDKQFLAKGGQGVVYVNGDWAYKIYSNSNHVIPKGKFDELQILTDPRLIKPEDMLLNDKGDFIGYKMPFIKNAYTLCQLFPKVFKVNNQLTMDTLCKLVQQMRKVVQHVHDKGLLIVDLNEGNILTSQDFSTVYFIDVDSYQTPNYKATAIMRNIADPHAKKFSSASDWFSFAVVSFNLLAGIHPYAGRHTKYKTMEERMQHNISVFDPDVTYPKSVTPFSELPIEYFKWFQDILQAGKRYAPPELGTGIIMIAVPPTNILRQSTTFHIEHLGEFEGEILLVEQRAGTTIVSTTSNIFINKRKYDISGVTWTVCWTSHKPTPILARINKDEKLVLYQIERQREIESDCAASSLMTVNGRLYIHNGDKILEAYITNDLLVSTQVVANAHPNTTKAYDGIIIQLLLGSTYGYIFPQSAKCASVRLSELDNYRIIDAKYRNGVLMVTGRHIKNQCYDRVTFRFDDDFTNYDCRVTTDVVLTGINFVVLDSGVVVCWNEEDKLEVFRSKMGHPDLKLIEDKSVDSHRTLFSNGSKVLFGHGAALYSISLSKK